MVNLLRLEITLIKIGFCSKVSPLEKETSATCAYNAKRLSLKNKNFDHHKNLFEKRSKLCTSSLHLRRSFCQCVYIPL